MAKRTPKSAPKSSSAKPKPATPATSASQIWSIAPALATAAAIYLASSYGLIFGLPEAQVGLWAGVAAGLAATAWLDAGIGAGIGVLIAAVAAPAWIVDPASWGTRILWAAVFAAVAAVAAGGTRWVVERVGDRWTRWIALAVMLVFVANAFYSAYVVNNNLPRVGERGETLTQWLSVEPTAGQYGSDESLFLSLYYRVKTGEPFYQAFLGASQGDTHFIAMPGVFGYRNPALYWFWRAVPGGATSLPYALLVLTALAVIAVYLALSRTVPAPFALVAGTAVLTYMLVYATESRLMLSEPWGAVLGVGAFAAFLMSDSGRKLWWTVGAVVLALLATLVREHMIMLLLAGLVAALAQRDTRSLRGWLPWALGIGAFALAFAAHAASVPAQTQAATGIAIKRWLQGGPEFIWAMLTTGGNYFAAARTLIVFAVAGIFGVVVAPKGTRAFLAVATLVPLAIYLVVGQEARLVTGTEAAGAAAGLRVAPWGPTLVPLLLCAVAYALWPIITHRIDWRIGTPSD